MHMCMPGSLFFFPHNLFYFFKKKCVYLEIYKTGKYKATNKLITHS